MNQAAGGTLSPPSNPSVPRKRKRAGETTERGSVSYPRQRALTACHVCRIRKIKCTNERPKCASCARLGSACVYDDSSLDHSSFDAASLLIIEKLNEVLRRIPCAPQSTWAPLTQAGRSDEPEVSFSKYAGDQATDFEALYTVSPFSSVEHLFTWPILGEDATALRIADTISAAEGWSKNLSGTNLPHQSKPRNQNFQQFALEQDLMQSVEKFLKFIHSRNPFLDIEYLRQCTRAVCELGAGWDAPSCLVVSDRCRRSCKPTVNIALTHHSTTQGDSPSDTEAQLLAGALGAIAKPYDAEPIDPIAPPAAIDLGAAPWATAEAYYYSARRRIGLLSPSVVTAQCYVLSGLYFMYQLLPLQGGQEYVRASITYLLHRKRREAVLRQQGETIEEMKYSAEEQRIFWTCQMLESEINSELQAPKSGIMDVTCANPFPLTPNTLLDNSNQSDPALETHASLLSTQESSVPRPSNTIPEQTTAWYYYLTEISLSRMINRILQAFYTTDHYSWTSRPMLPMLEAVHSFEEQLASWIVSLPKVIQFTGPFTELVAQDEHRFTLRQRYAYICSLLYRPFLYIAAHVPELQPPQHSEALNSLAWKAVRCCFIANDGFGSRHRYSGLWFDCRLAGINILTLAAARKAGLLTSERLEEADCSQEDIVRALEVNRATLNFWSQGSPDLKALKEAVDCYIDVTGRATTAAEDRATDGIEPQSDKLRPR